MSCSARRIPIWFATRARPIANSLMARVRELGVEDHVVFLDQFVDQATLLDFISMCDVYVTPYLNEAQMTSGTLAYSFGLGKPVVSTPYWHARELLADGLRRSGAVRRRGRRSVAKSRNCSPMTSAGRRCAGAPMRCSRSMTWERTAERYMSVFENARQGHRLKVFARSDTARSSTRSPAPPDMQIGHFLSMCDDTGLFQHAVHSVPDRAHGYCVDDNARALLLACALNNPGEQPLSDVLTARFAAFVQHAWNPDTRQFRNFMGFNRTWLEDRGSEDSHGRTLWALGESARSDASPSRRRWATALFAEALPTVESFRSPRAWAFTLLGLDAYCAVAPDDLHASEVRHSLADRLMSCLAAGRDAGLGVVRGGAGLRQRAPAAGPDRDRAWRRKRRIIVDAGLRSLRWLMTQQTTAAGHFRPVGTAGFGELRQHPRAFDQQPVEATATIAACLAAWRADGDAEWKAMAARAFAWFLGSNDLAVPLVDLAHRKLPRRIASRSRQRKSRRRVGCVLSAWAGGDSSACARQHQPDQARGAARRGRLNFTSRSSKPRTAVSQATFLNRQALYLRPDPARVIVRPFKPATEPRDLNPTDKTRANHIVDRVLALDSEAVAARARGRPGKFPGTASQSAGDVRGPRGGNGGSFCGAWSLFKDPAPAGRRLFSQ